MKLSPIISSQPLVFTQELAEQIGVTPAIVFQKIHFLLGCPDNGKSIDGVRWIYNTANEWKEKYFRFWSTETLERTLRQLEKDGLLRSIQPEKAKSRRKYYTITEYGYNFIMENNADFGTPTSRRGFNRKQKSEAVVLTPSENDAVNSGGSDAVTSSDSYKYNTTTIRQRDDGLFGMSADDFKIKENREILVTKQKDAGIYSESVLLDSGVTDEDLCLGVTMLDMYVYLYMHNKKKIDRTEFPPEVSDVLSSVWKRIRKESGVDETLK